MKKLPLLLLAAAFGSMSASAQFRLSGHIGGMPDSLRLAVVNVENPDNTRLICTTYPTDGAFTLMSDSLTQPTVCELRLQRHAPKMERFTTLCSARFVASAHPMQLEPTTMKALEDASDDYRTEQAMRITGGEAQEGWNTYLAELFETERAAKLAGYKQAQVYFDTNNNPDSVRKYRILEKEANARLLQARVDFARRHPASIPAAYWMDREICTLFIHSAEELESMAALVQACPDTARVNAVNRHLQTALKYALHRPYVDFDLTLPDGQTARFSSLVPKEADYTLVDFWASWCSPCRAAIPHVKEMGAKYGRRLGILSISVDRKEADWRKAMGEEGMTWPQAWLKGSQMNTVADAYVIQSIPRLLLIDSEGRIVVSTYLPDEITEYIQKNITL